MSAGVSFYKYLRLSYRDIAPRLGVPYYPNISLSRSTRIVFGERAYVRGRIYFPGLFKHHSFQMAGGYYEQKAAVTCSSHHH
jgi:hypothetical protein